MASPYIVRSALKVVLHHACPIAGRIALAVKVNFVKALMWVGRDGGGERG